MPGRGQEPVVIRLMTIFMVQGVNQFGLGMFSGDIIEDQCASAIVTNSLKYLLFLNSHQVKRSIMVKLKEPPAAFG